MRQVDARRPESVAGVEASEVARRLDVDVAVGLSQAEAASRLQANGPNKLAGGKTESGFQAFVRQYKDFMQIVLLVAAAVNLIVTGEIGTSLVLAGLTLFNAMIGLRQEAKAEESVKALSQMMKTVARVRRGGQAVEIDAEELVVGDVVLVEAGNRVPADGRICVAATLEIEEAALTGESLPVAKGTDPVPGDEVALGDRTCMAYMNTSVTRGRGEMIVTATGMDTEIDQFVMVTDVDGVYTGWATPEQRKLGRVTSSQLRELRFAAGSMGPKVEAAIRFVETTGNRAAIGGLNEIEAIVAGDAGTQVVAP